jgi:hypothetical protein
MHKSIPVVLLKIWGLLEYALGIRLTNILLIALDMTFSLVVRNVKILGVNVFEKKCLLLFFLTLVPV